MKIGVFTVGLAFTAVATLAHAQPTIQQPTPQKMQLAHQLVEASGGQERVIVAIQTIMGTIDKGLEKNMPPDQARLMAMTHDALQQEMVGIAPALVQVVEHVYAQNLTEKELVDQLAWLNSDSGRSIQQKTPLILQQMAEAEVPMIQAMMPRLAQHIVDRVCAEAKCSEHDREVVTVAMAKAMATHPS